MKKIFFIVLFVFVSMASWAYWKNSSAIAEAEDFARGLAVQIQKRCKTNSLCPEHLPGWEVTGEAFEWYFHGDNKIKIGYASYQDTFQLFVRHFFARGLLINGGSNTKITEERWQS